MASVAVAAATEGSTARLVRSLRSLVLEPMMCIDTSPGCRDKPESATRRIPKPCTLRRRTYGVVSGVSGGVYSERRGRIDGAPITVTEVCFDSFFYYLCNCLVSANSRMLAARFSVSRSQYVEIILQ